MTEALKSWVSEKLQPRGLTQQGEIEVVQENPASTVLKVNTNDGILYAKADRLFPYEAALTASLARWFPQYIPEVVAVDRAENRTLSRDAGTTIRALAKADSDFSRHDEMLTRFAELQKAAISKVPELLAIGIPDRRLEVLPTLYQQLIAEDADLTVLHLDKPDGIPSSLLPALRGFTPQIERWCDALARFHIPETLHHDDFHDRNSILLDGVVRFIDWGESAVAHPFFSLMIAQRSAKYVLNMSQEQLDHLRDVYLSAWLDYGSLETLQDAYQVAGKLAIVCRALTWSHVVNTLPVDQRGDYFDGPPYWIQLILTGDPMRGEL